MALKTYMALKLAMKLGVDAMYLSWATEAYKNAIDSKAKMFSG